MPSKGLTLRRARDLRSALTTPEVKLWCALRAKQLNGWRFRRQHPLPPWIVDFYCAEARLAVEIDGWSHNMGDPARDEWRDADLAHRGVRVIRFTAEDVMKELESVLETISAALRP